MATDANSTLTPKLRFSDFRDAEGWEDSTLGDVTTKTDRRNREGKAYPVYSISNKAGFIPQSEQFEGVDSAMRGYDLSLYKVIERNTFAYNPARINVGSIGYSGDLNDIIISSLYVCFKTTERVDDRFLFQFFGTTQFEHSVRNKVEGGIRSYLFYENFADIRVAIPLLDEQQKIAECLSTLDELIGAEGQKLDTLKAYKKGLMQRLFPREGAILPRIRFSEFLDAPEWMIRSVEELVEANYLFPPRDGNHGNLHPKSADYVARGIPFIMASDLNGGLIDTVSCHFISQKLAATLQKGFAKEGDVLLSHKGTVGEVAVVRNIKTPYLMLTPQVTYYRVKDHDNLSNEFLAQYFLSEVFQSNLIKASGGGTRSYIGITEQARLRVVLPSDISEQHRVASCLSSLDELITAQSDKHEALKNHKKGLMQRLFPSPAELAE